MPITSKTKKLLWAVAILLLLTSVGIALWTHRFASYTPAEVTQDIRAAIAAKNAPRPVERFLELRYGPLTDPTNRKKAFLDFFNVGHIEGLQIIVSRTPEHMKQANMESMARWVADYRNSMSPEEKQALGDFFRSEAGQAQLQKATAQYLKQDVHYRAHTAPVNSELMATVSAVQNP
ncbi:MAG TPA: hypothetical protein VEC99_14000 [Clostridia bacterium]|nr:hypothetical protein [Clostridia bacterium]